MFSYNSFTDVSFWLESLNYYFCNFTLFFLNVLYFFCSSFSPSLPSFSAIWFFFSSLSFWFLIWTPEAEITVTIIKCVCWSLKLMIFIFLAPLIHKHPNLVNLSSYILFHSFFSVCRFCFFHLNCFVWFCFRYYLIGMERFSNFPISIKYSLIFTYHLKILSFLWRILFLSFGVFLPRVFFFYQRWVW